jgi:hypothetical protein
MSSPTAATVAPVLVAAQPLLPYTRSIGVVATRSTGWAMLRLVSQSIPVVVVVAPVVFVTFASRFIGVYARFWVVVVAPLMRDIAASRPAGSYAYVTLSVGEVVSLVRRPAPS